MTHLQFFCPVCDRQFEVNGAMREAMLTHGCPVCGAAIDPDSFRAT